MNFRESLTFAGQLLLATTFVGLLVSAFSLGC
jgi:hypothetical protein